MSENTNRDPRFLLIALLIGPTIFTPLTITILLQACKDNKRYSACDSLCEQRKAIACAATDNTLYAICAESDGGTITRSTKEQP